VKNLLFSDISTLRAQMSGVETLNYSGYDPKACNTVCELWLYFGKQDPGAMSSTSFVYSSKMDTDEMA
jgi:hypothetical protein